MSEGGKLELCNACFIDIMLKALLLWPHGSLKRNGHEISPPFRVQADGMDSEKVYTTLRWLMRGTLVYIIKCEECETPVGRRKTVSHNFILSRVKVDRYLYSNGT